MKKILFWPDTHVPVHNRTLVRALIKLVGEFQPDELVMTGDIMDYKQPSRWTKDTREEFEGSIFEDSQVCERDVLTPLRTVYGGPIGLIAGNHDTRPRDYLRKYAPALDASHAFDLDVLLNLAEYDITLLPDIYDVAPGWVAIHGHIPKPGMSQTAGMSALNKARNKIGKNVVMGHTHRLGTMRHTIGANTVVGMEVGHITNPDLMPYVQGEWPNWQHGFGLMYVDGNTVAAHAIPIEKGRFIVEGTAFAVR